MARTAAARFLLAVASTLLLLIAGCATGTATAGPATAATTQQPANGGAGGGGTSRSGAEGELVKDDVVRTGSPARRHGSPTPHAPGRGFLARGVDEHGGDAERSRPGHRTALSRGTPAAQRATLLQVFRR